MQSLTPHNRTLEVRPGRITKKLELKYDYDCEGDDTKSLLGVLMLGCDIVIEYLTSTTTQLRHTLFSVRDTKPSYFFENVQSTAIFY